MGSGPHLDRGAGPGFKELYSRTADRTHMVVVVVVIMIAKCADMAVVEPKPAGYVKNAILLRHADRGECLLQ